MPSDNEVLKFNYEILHNSIQSNHGYSWSVSGIFIPLLFTLQGLIIQSSYPDNPTKIVLYALIIEFMVFIWWTIMFMFRRYNNVRIERLRKIEQLFNKSYNQIEIPIIEQYTLDYEWNIPKINIKLEFFDIYNVFFGLITLTNIFLILLPFYQFPLKQIYYFSLIILFLIVTACLYISRSYQQEKRAKKNKAI